MYFVGRSNVRRGIVIPRRRWIARSFPRRGNIKDNSGACGRGERGGRHGRNWEVGGERRRGSPMEERLHAIGREMRSRMDLGGARDRGFSVLDVEDPEVAHSVGELLRQRGCFRFQDTGGINDKNFRKLSPSALSSIWRTQPRGIPSVLVRAWHNLPISRVSFVIGERRHLRA